MNIHYLAQRKIKFDFAISGLHNLKHFTHLTLKEEIHSGENVSVNPLTPRSNMYSNSPYSQPYNSYNVSSENLVLDQLTIPKLIFFFIPITYCMIL